MILKKSKSMADYAVRRGTPDDAKGVIECMQSVMDEKIYLVSEYYLLTERGERERLKNKDDLTLVCEVNGKIAGVTTIQRGMYRKNRHVASMGIAIRKEYRHMGMGTRMIREAISWSKQQGIEKLNLEVFSSNINAIQAYRNLGFQYEGVRKRQFLIGEQYVDDVLMTYFTSAWTDN
jgi:RimJ/RimL family protein N-acetyltransferase